MSKVASGPLLAAVPPSKQGARRHYGSHPYFTKRAWNVVQAYIEHFSKPGDVVLDPFGGSGVTAVESLVLRRRAIYVDVSEWACFLARQTAIAPVDLRAFRVAFLEVEDECRADIERIWAMPESTLAKKELEHWYPRGIRLPKNSDVEHVEDLFTPRMLHGLARLRAAIMREPDTGLRDLLRMAFSATLARINRTFLSTSNRRESRGGAAIFSIYRYKVAKRPVELPLWDQFATRVARLIDAKRETNALIGDFYHEPAAAVFRHDSVSRLGQWLEPESVDYIYTDPPYGGHIAYLDLSTMWTAWLGLGISDSDRAEEIIEGGDRQKSAEDYHEQMSRAFAEMAATLKSNRWISVVFAHRDTSYWESLVEACRSAGLDYVNTVVQPVGVVWSMHKKRNPLRVLSGELVLNFRKRTRVKRAAKPSGPTDAERVVLECCERAIFACAGASTEDLHHAVVPRLLETGLLASFSREHGDLTPLLQRWFEFDNGRWYIPASGAVSARIPAHDILKYHLRCFLQRRHNQGRAATEVEMKRYLDDQCGNGARFTRAQLREMLRDVAYSPDDRRWRLACKNEQQEMSFEE